MIKLSDFIWDFLAENNVKHVFKWEKLGLVHAEDYDKPESLSLGYPTNQKNGEEIVP